MIKIGAVFIPVTDVERSTEWYKEKLELNHVGTWPDNAGADFYFTTEKQYLTLVKVHSKPPTTFLDHSHFETPFFNFTTDDLRAYHQQLQQKGVPVTEIKDHGVVVGFDFYDPDGNKLGVVVDKENYSE